MHLQHPPAGKLSLNCPQLAAFEHRELLPAASLGYSSAKQGGFSTWWREGVRCFKHIRLSLAHCPQITSAFDMEAVTFKKLVKGHAYSVTAFRDVSWLDETLMAIKQPGQWHGLSIPCLVVVR